MSAIEGKADVPVAVQTSQLDPRRISAGPRQECGGLSARRSLHIAYDAARPAQVPNHRLTCRRGHAKLMAQHMVWN
jgi:hypothetical protein